MRIALWIGVVVTVVGLYLPRNADAATCGTVAAPITCTVTSGAAVFTLSNFVFDRPYTAPGATIYTAADVNIDATALLGSRVRIMFSKNAASPGTVFFAGTGDESQLRVSYSVSITHNVAYNVQFGSTVEATMNNVTMTGLAIGNLDHKAESVSCVVPATGGDSTVTCNNVVSAGQTTLAPTAWLRMNQAGTGTFSIGAFGGVVGAVQNVGIGDGVDVDGDGIYRATTDGLLIMRYMLGLRGAALIDGAVGAGAKRTTATTIQTYLSTLMP